MAGRGLWAWFKKTWPDWLNVSVGAWMIVSAVLPRWSGPPAGQWASGLSGAAIVVVSLLAVVKVELWKEWVNLLLGIWLVAAPFVLGIGDFDPFWNFVLDGLFLAGHALYQMLNPPHRREGA